MKIPHILAFVTLAGAATANAVDLKVNLGPSNTDMEPGFTNWTTGDNSAPSPITVNGVELFLAGSISDETEDVIRSLRRTINPYSGPLANVTRSWWGARLKDQRQADGPPYDSGGFLTIGIRGSDLGEGAFQWTSWHHDFNDQRGYIDIDVSVDGGDTFTNAVSEFKIVNGGNELAPNPVSFPFTSNGIDDIHVRFTNVEVEPNTHSTIFALLNGFEIVSDPTIRLTITPAVPPATGFDLEWDSRSGKQYALRTRDDLDLPVSQWDVLADNIVATPPKNLLNVQGDGPRRFYAIEEFDALPLFFRNFEDDDGGFTVVPDGTGSQWQHGTPDAEDEGGGFDIKSGNDGSNGAWGVNLTGPYDSNTDTALRSPLIDLTDVPEAVDASLFFALALDMNANASLVVRVLDGVSGDPIGDPLLTRTGTTFDDWERLGPFELPRESVRIEWRFTDPDEYPEESDRYLGAYIDDVEILLD